MMIIVGGIKDPKMAELVVIEADTHVPELPLVFEDEESAAPVTPEAGPSGT